ncbi:MAG: integral rane protein YccS/YhfK family [Rhizobacter sp.]|nr:integral rane protein YccS/YhfK family [Rhizobacter sp.]
MSSSSAFDTTRQRLNALASRAQPVRVLLTLGSLMALNALGGRNQPVIPLFLGAIASALAETDDSWRGRLRAQLVTLACFAIAAFAVQAVIVSPFFYIVFLCAAAFCLTLLGAVEARYKAIGYATLILAMYATISIAGQPEGSLERQREPFMLLLGAAWYGVFSVASAMAFSAQPVQARLASLFTVLGEFVRFKASLFEPVRGVDFEAKRLSLTRLNASVVTELNASKESIFRRIGAKAPTGRLARFRGLYLIAQDVHERASSSHDDYTALADTFFHSDLLYRCQRVLSLQGDACTRLAESIERREPFVADIAAVQALADLRSAIDHERRHAETPHQLELLESVDALRRNLAKLDGQLTGASQPAAEAGRTDMGLFDRSPRTWRDAVARVRRHLTTRSPLFRHGVRLAVALAIGYAFMRAIHPAQGYWIMLTTLFVCQMTYGETMARLGQRIAGTVFGVLAGWALQQLFPQPLVQAFLAVAAGVFFFATRSTRYLVATASMTVLVLLCFNQVGDSSILIVPRLIDTVIGSIIAGLAVLLVLPNWQASHFNELAGTSMKASAEYLRQVLEQYRSGARDDLAYRLARRNAHNADSALATAVNDMFREPGYVRPHADVALRLLIQSHTMLNYISALGAHRVALPDPSKAAVLQAAAAAAGETLDLLADGLKRAHVDGIVRTDEVAVRKGLSTMAVATDRSDPSERLVRTELALIWLQVDALRTHAQEWVRPGTDEAGMKSAGGLPKTSAS